MVPQNGEANTNNQQNLTSFVLQAKQCEISRMQQARDADDSKIIALRTELQEAQTQAAAQLQVLAENSQCLFFCLTQVT